VISYHNIHRDLIDLGASVNLLPFTVYERLGLGGLKLIKMAIQLANRSTRVYRGMVEDVLIKVREFIFPADFAVRETEGVMNTENEILIILGRPYLATSNALTNSRDGKLKLTFENMTIELNMFNFQNNQRVLMMLTTNPLIWLGDLALGEVDVDYEEELM